MNANGNASPNLSAPSARCHRAKQNQVGFLALLGLRLILEQVLCQVRVDLTASLRV